MTMEIINRGTEPNDGTGDSLRTAFGKINNNFTELYTVSSNNWINPDTGNNFGMIQLQGATKVTFPNNTSNTINTIALIGPDGFDFIGYNVATDTNFQYVYIPKDESTNSFFIDSRTNNFFSIVQDKLYSYLTINGNTFQIYTESFTSNTILLGINNIGSNIYYFNANDEVVVNLTYQRDMVPWFDPDALGITNFRGADIKYRAWLDGANGSMKIGHLAYVYPYVEAVDFNPITTGYYAGTFNAAKANSRNKYSGSGSDFASNLNPYFIYLESMKYDNKLYTDYNDYNNIFNSAYPAPNLYVQWTATVWTGVDGRND